MDTTPRSNHWPAYEVLSYCQGTSSQVRLARYPLPSVMFENEHRSRKVAVVKSSKSKSKCKFALSNEERAQKFPAVLDVQLVQLI